MQTFVTILSLLLLFSTTGFAHPAPNALASPDDVPLERRDNVRCYHGGYATTRAKLTKAIDDFCDKVHSDGGLRKNKAVEKSFSLGNSAETIISVKPKQCSAIDKDLQCKITLRQAVDECNTDSANFKQGGTVDTGCAKWRVDPNL
ncbi:hypothetical protein M409DRAFT_16808 [Zasmidium cellare ATCC 36951]|uniref:Ecp2 effector protein domain-containing protein n=1 Tax=Zasmidium cellare ATCC 36951 TaxID=1080233 RepID=A0A6A6D1C8_ZASCE|nr:uncharacterized protein M409DRAFT_16808 [Zasmidium cellare ATCC 36951]KAF2172853.1 hypothetical protein M409DRAFT_16808 [Zasmidium cellare ATCC 36951]